jgi:hypothetical protein
MTITSQTTRKQYVGTAVPTSEYPVTFQFLEADDLVVKHTATNGTVATLKLDTDYTVTGGDGENGTVTVTNANYRAGTGEYLTIYLDAELKQETDLQNLTAFYPEVIERMGDRITLFAQQLQEQLDRAMIYSPETPSPKYVNVADLSAEMQIYLAEASGSASTAVAARDAALSAQAAAENARDEAEHIAEGPHNNLTNRDVSDAHPIVAITGLQDALDRAQGTARRLGGFALLDIPGITTPPTLELFPEDWEAEENGCHPRLDFVRPSSASYVDSLGVIQTANNNALRHDYDPVTGEYKGILIEEQRTNLFLNALADGTNLSTQNVIVSAQPYTVSFYGSGSIVFSGSHSATLSGTGTYPDRVTLTFTPSAGTLTCTVTGDVKYAQIEAGSFATSFIPTTTAAATRAADVLSVATSTFPFSVNEGAIYVEAETSAWANRPVAARLDDGTNDNRIWLNINSYGDGRLFARAAGVVVGDITLSGMGDDIFRCAFSWAEDGFATCFNGGDVGTYSSGAIPQGITALYIGSTGTVGFWNGHIRHITYFPRRLTNTALQALTN